ncbi:MAG: glycosyltransferase family 1 protein [Gemmataceae bacterium]|nr:glycosyltransferase family 1 protein [Gemmataceae bacterium]
MRILFLSPIGSIGGAERVLLSAVAGVRRADPTSTLRVIALTDGPLLAAAAALSAETEVVPMPASLRSLGDSQMRSAGRWGERLGLLGRAALAVPDGGRYLARLRTAVARARPDVIHSNGIKTHLLSRVVVPRRTPVVWHLHDFYGLRPLAARLLRRARGRVRAAIAISRAVAADAGRSLPGVPVVVVPNAVDLTTFGPGPADDLDRLAGLPPAVPGTIRLGLVGTYARWKGHLTVLDAAKALAGSHPDLPVRWYLVGGPIYHTAAQFTEAELRRAAADRGVADRVGFIPFRPCPAGVYRGLDVVVHASTLPEPFGLTVAEAMACGRAVIVSAAGGAAELFTDGLDGVGVAPGDAAGLAAAAGRLASDAAFRARLGAAARATAEDRLDDARYGPQLLAVYRPVLAMRGHGG